MLSTTKAWARRVQKVCNANQLGMKCFADNRQCVVSITLPGHTMSRRTNHHHHRTTVIPKVNPIIAQPGRPAAIPVVLAEVAGTVITTMTTTPPRETTMEALVKARQRPEQAARMHTKRCPNTRAPKNKGHERPERQHTNCIALHCSHHGIEFVFCKSIALAFWQLLHVIKLR